MTGGTSRLPHGLEQLGLADRAVVVQVQRVAAGRVALRDVGLSPSARHGQVGLDLGRGACSASSASAISAAPQSMSLFHSVPG